ncbi:MAG: YndJ family transporter [Actinomycetota bacterium]
MRRFLQPSPTWIRRACAGGVLWLLWAAIAQPTWTALLLVLSPFVLVPLGLRLTVAAGPTTPIIDRVIRWAPALALSAGASFLPTAGWLAALLTVPWFAFTVTTAGIGVARLLSRRRLADPAIGTDAGLLFLAVGGAWLTISRAGLNPLGFSDAIVELTAVHFHYAGFALPTVAGFVTHRRNGSALVPAAVIIGVPLTALGITIGGWLEWTGATVMAIAGMATAMAMLRAATTTVGAARTLLTTAGAALLAGMGLAIGWAWSIRFGWSFLALETMAATHGSLNALGFGLLGLIGLNLLTTTTPDDAQTSVHLGRPTRTHLEELQRRADAQPTTNPIGMLHRPVPPGFHAKQWWRRAGHDDFETAVEAIRRWRGHAAAGIALAPEQPAITEGQTLALTIPVAPISVSATCRIVEVIDEPNRYGFTYATLPHHPEDGEESFIVTRNNDGTVDVIVTAIWRPATLANHVCPPLTRFLQDRAINRYLDGIVAPATRRAAGAR